MVKNIVMPVVYLILYLVTHTTQTIFKPTTVFYSQLCSLGHVSPAASTVITCTTLVAQENIIRTGITLSEFTKPGNEYFSFNASVSAGGRMASSFAITIQMAMPVSGMNLGYFLLVIKDQATAQMIDLIPWSWGPGTTVDTEENLNRTISQLQDLITLTIFTSGTGLTAKCLLTSMHITPRLSSGSFSSGTDTQIILNAAISGNMVNITLDVFDETRVSFIRGIVLLYNTATITAQATTNSWDMLLKQVSFNDPANYAFATDFIAFGPQYNGKCLLGYNKIFVEGYHNINFNIANTTLGNFSIMNFNTDSPTKQYGIVFCFGNDSTICGQNQIWIDSLTGLCYLPTTCPLPVFALWTLVNLCPICTQLICSNCTITNRSNCLTCGLYSTLTSGKCICDAGYWPLMTAISTSTLGMWNGVANSQTQCRQNCTAQIPGCAFDKCTSGTFCIICSPGFTIKPINATDQGCVACPLVIPNCTVCSSQTTCTTCDTLYFLIPWNKQCSLCSATIPGCLTCQPYWPCTLCDVGWALVWGGCLCDPVASSLLYCQTCSNPTTCTACVSNLYFLKTADTKCYPCTAFDPNCDQCSAENVCTLCFTNFGIQTYTNATTLCVPCSTITNCLQCLVLTACTLCATNYYPTSSGICELCSVPMPGCIPCTDGATCTSCDTGWTLTSAKCVCNTTDSLLSDCQTCANPLTCTSCVSNLFYLFSTDTLCYPCQTFDTNCQQCSAFQVCSFCTTTWGVQTNTNGSTLCVLCSTAIPNCTQCLVSTTCTLCEANYFITNAGDCQLCSVRVPGCLTCVPTILGVACNTCDVGWQLTWFRCVCDPVASNLTDCQRCASPIVCTRCVSTMFYIDPIDFHCYPCTTFDPNCVQCGSIDHCSMCAITYGIQTNSDGTTLCILCNSTLSNCTQCTVVSACTNCDYGFGMNLALTCSTCVSLFNGCVECQTSVACLVCVSDAFLIMGRCRYCWELFSCISCVSNATSMGCVGCQIGYYLTPDPLTGDMYCRICKDLTSYCSVCSSSECITCENPYLLGPDKTCSLCSPGFQYNNGFCTNITGCQNIVLNSTGQQVCIACVQSLHFIMDVKNNKCICAIGYKQVLQPQISLLPKCYPTCGDGIVVPQQGCDDKNTIENDGCSSTCLIQKDFECGNVQPSACILHVNIGSIRFNHVYRTLGLNQGVMSFTIYPKHDGLLKMKWEKLIKFNFSSTAVDPAKISFTYQPMTGEILVTVPYNQEIQQTSLESFFTLDPAYIVSQPSNFLITHHLKGVNAPLIFQRQSQLATQQNINLITLLLTILLLLQFYAGSLSHKMIGLETIQVIQSIYFVRMVAASSSTSLMNSINSIQYSAGGYHNSELFYGDTKDIELNLYGSTNEKFLMIELKRYFLLNANLSLFPIIIASLAFLVTLIRKFRARNEYIETKQQQLKDKYTTFRRSSQWVYDHFLFPYIMMFSLISYFQTILLLSSPTNLTDEYANIQNPSFAVHMVLTLSTMAIYCYELFSSFEAYSRYAMTESQRQKVPKSMVQKLEHDENNSDRANYHPAYIFCYLLYYFFLSLCMVGTVVLPQFSYALQVNMGLSIVYFMVIIFWKPYAPAVNIHNHFLKFYYGTFVVFLVFCYIFSRMDSLGSTTYIMIMYLITALIACIMVAGFIRVYIEYSFRKALDLDNSLLGDLKGKKEVQQKILKDENGVVISKKQALVMNNQYAFENQLKEYEKRLNAPMSIMNTNLMKNLSVNMAGKKDYLVKKIREDIYKKKQNILLQTIAHDGYTNEMRRVNEKYEQQNEKDGEIDDGLETGQSNLADTILGRSNMGDSLLKRIPSQDCETPTAGKISRDDIKIKLRKQWALMDYE